MALRSATKFNFFSPRSTVASNTRGQTCAQGRSRNPASWESLFSFLQKDLRLP